MPSDLAQDLSGKESGCLFQQLLQSKPMQLLFQLLHQQPVLSLILSDLGHLVDESTGKQSGDLTLEPWYHEHCKVVPQCQENFSTAVLAEEVQWKMVAKGLYSHSANPLVWVWISRWVMCVGFVGTKTNRDLASVKIGSALF